MGISRGVFLVFKTAEFSAFIPDNMKTDKN